MRDEIIELMARAGLDEPAAAMLIHGQSAGAFAQWLDGDDEAGQSLDLIGLKAKLVDQAGSNAGADTDNGAGETSLGVGPSSGVRDGDEANGDESGAAKIAANTDSEDDVPAGLHNNVDDDSNAHDAWAAAAGAPEAEIEWGDPDKVIAEAMGQIEAIVAKRKDPKRKDDVSITEIRLTMEFAIERATRQNRGVVENRICQRIASITDQRVGDLRKLWASILPEQDAAEDQPEMTPEEVEHARAELLEHCQHIAEAPDIVGEAVKRMHTMGVVGEEKLIRLLVVASFSRVMPQPVGTLIKGSSAGGKSYVTQTVLRLLDPSSVVEMTGASDRALVYLQEGVKHKVLCIFEATQLQRDDESLFAYFLRTLISEQKIVYPNTVVDPKNGERRTVNTQVDGPVAAMITTTAESINEENETRLISYRVTETADQTRAILVQLGRAAAAGAGPATQAELPEDWQAYDRWLGLGSNHVVIPFAQVLTALVPPDQVRFRRDVGALLSLIRTSAVMHQLTRDCDEKGRIEATIDDYATVREVVETTMAQAAGRTPSPSVHAVVEYVLNRIADQKDSSKDGQSSSRRQKSRRVPANSSPDTIELSGQQIAKDLGVSRSTVSRAITTACEWGYLANEQMRPRGPAILRQGTVTIDGLSISPLLPTVEQLQEALASEESIPAASAEKDTE